MNTNSEVVAYAKRSIEIAARKLIGKCGITRADLEDIESEMMLDVLQRLPKHDNQRWSVKTFIPHVVKNKSHHILRQRCSDKAQIWRQTISMDAPCQPSEGNGEPQTLHDIVSDKSTIGSGVYGHVDMCHDLEVIVGQLNAIQKQCCRAIMNGQPISKIAKDHSMPRSTFYEQVIAPIRQAFSKAGLEEYLK